MHVGLAAVYLYTTVTFCIHGHLSIVCFFTTFIQFIIVVIYFENNNVNRQPENHQIWLPNGYTLCLKKCTNFETV